LFPAPHPFHPSACKCRQGITHQSSIRPSGASAPVNPHSYPAFSSQRSGQNHSTAKSPPRQISIDGQVLTAFPRVRSSEAFRRRPSYRGYRSRPAGIRNPSRLQTFPPSPRNGAVRPKPSRLVRLIEVALSVSAGGSSKQEKRWREAGRDRQVEAVSKRRKADQFRRTCRAAVLRQSRLRPRRWPRPVVLGLLGKRCCAPDRSRARRRALRPQVRQGVPVPGRLATPSARGENACESWPRPS
jgi:hypothetical protein